MTIEDEDASLVSKLAGLSAGELLAAVAAAAGERTAQERKEIAAETLKEYVRKGNVAGLGEDHPLTRSALEIERRRQTKEQTNE